MTDFEYRPCAITCEVNEDILDAARAVDAGDFHRLGVAGNRMGFMNQLVGLMLLTRWDDPENPEDIFDPLKRDAINTLKLEMINQLGLPNEQIERLQRCANAIASGACRAYQLSDEGSVVSVEIA